MFTCTLTNVTTQEIEEIKISHEDYELIRLLIFSKRPNSD